MGTPIPRLASYHYRYYITEIKNSMAQNTPPTDAVVQAILASPILQWLAGIGIFGGIFYFFYRLTQKIIGNGNGNGKTAFDKLNIVLEQSLKMNEAYRELLDATRDATEPPRHLQDKDDTQV